jgi:hypothetical protein
MKYQKTILSLMTIAITLGITTIPMTTNFASVYASTGMSNCTEEPESEDCNPQPDRVGNDPDDHDPNDDADRDGPGGDDESPETEEDEGDSNCWGQVTKSLTQNDDDQPGIGEHSSDPVPGDEDNEVPREGVGNQDEGHPSDHADQVGGLADDVPDCVD